MRKRVAATAGTVVILGSLVFIVHWKRQRDARIRAGWDRAITAVLDTTRSAGWLETFESPHTQPLTEYDPRWEPLFGDLLVNARLGAAIGKRVKGRYGDDYAYRASDTPTGSVEITLDAWWDDGNSIGAEGAVQAAPPHQLYEAALWHHNLALFHFTGPTSAQYDTLAQSPALDVSTGFYRIVFRMELRDSTWHLMATLQDPRKTYAVIAKLSATDSRLGRGTQGIGLYGLGGTSYITGIAVRALDDPSTSSDGSAEVAHPPRQPPKQAHDSIAPPIESR